MKIIIRKDGQFFKEVDFVDGEITVGRSTEADIQLLHEDVSRKHVRIKLKRGKLELEDLESKNGTYLQGSRIQKTKLEEGEIFNIGPFAISIEKEAPQSQRTVVEHDLSEAPTRTFYQNPKENTHTSSRSIKPSDFPSLSQDKEQDEKLESESDSFLDAISVAPEASNPSYAVNPDEEVAVDVDEALQDKSSPAFKLEGEEEESNPDFEPTTNPYRSVPEYLKEVAKREKGKSQKNVKTEVMDPVTKPHDSFKDIRAEDDDQELIKTEIRKTEITGERSLKDFPSATETQDDNNHSEHFFLNRELDEEGIPGSFENFPDTNKIKPSENVASSFDTAAIGKVADEEDDSIEKTDPIYTEPELKVKKESDPDLISTGSFSNAETNLMAPEEDQIKTFMFNAKEVSGKMNTEKTDEFSHHKKKTSITAKLFKKIPALQASAKTWVKKPGRKKLVFITGAVVLGVMMFFMMEGGSLFHSEPVDPEVAIRSEESFQKLGRGEKKRVILFQIDQIQKLINKKEMTEADDRMRKLMTLAPKDADFVKFEKDYQRQRDAIVAEAEQKKKEEEEKQKKKDDAMKEAKKMADTKQYDLAKKTYTRILEIFPDDPDVREKLQTLELMQEQEERKAFAKKQRYDMLNKIFNEGVQKYESGQVGVAQKLFKQVTSEKGHPKYKKALEYLGRVDSMADKKIDQKINAARSMIQNPDTLLQGYAELKKITTQFPLRSDAKKYFMDAKTKMDKKARELYADALAQEELAGDPAAALDLYKEVLKYAPDKSNKYNQKAQAKIGSLQL